MYVTICDRCGQRCCDVNDMGRNYVLQQRDCSDRAIKIPVDLCNSCYGMIEKWMLGGDRLAPVVDG